MDNSEQVLREKLGSALKAARLGRQLTQSDLAEAVGTEPETISRFERGVALPSLTRLLSLADALEVTVVSLLGAASPRAQDEWEELRASLGKLAPKDRRLAMAVLKAIVESRAG